ncbi:right-handed parallel beta-helix repeat-containing protein [Myxococcota bacterium]|nr:right-handed parallel beta-helix repeat-containing protein [Myxococcota bacterium]
MSKLIRMSSLLALGSLASYAVLLMDAGQARAVDGVLEINHTCASLTGCFPGDPAGYPVRISAPGSYRLTSNLQIPDQNTTGVEIFDNDVTLDMNGFSIIRGGCVGAVTSCSPPNGTGDGIRANSVRRTTVTNGSIVGMGDEGVDLGEQSHVERLRVSWNHGTGILVVGDSTIFANTVLENDGSGIDAAGSNIADNVVIASGGFGIRAGVGAVVRNNAVERNGASGVNAVGAATIIGNSVRDNGGSGVEGGNGSNISDNIVNSNGADGIFALSECLVSRNVARNNVDFGLDLDPTTSYRDNLVSGNAGGTVDSGIAFAFSGNVCNGFPVCP